MANNANLRSADAAKNDEFYTRYEDIQAELNHYEKHFDNYPFLTKKIGLWICFRERKP